MEPISQQNVHNEQAIGQVFIKLVKTFFGCYFLHAVFEPPFLFLIHLLDVSLHVVYICMYFKIV